MSATRRLWWVLASWIVLAAALSWQQTELARCEELEVLLRKQNAILKKICAREHDVADVAEQVCLPCEDIQRGWLGVLGTHHNPRGYGSRSKRTSGHVGGGLLLDER